MDPNQIKHSLNGHAVLRSRYKRLCICSVHTTIFIYNKKQIYFGIGVSFHISFDLKVDLINKFKLQIFLNSFEIFFILGLLISSLIYFSYMLVFEILNK